MQEVGPLGVLAVWNTKVDCTIMVHPVPARGALICDDYCKLAPKLQAASTWPHSYCAT